MAKGRPETTRAPSAIESRLGELILELGRLADGVAPDGDTFDALSRAIRELVVARERVRGHAGPTQRSPARPPSR